MTRLPVELAHQIPVCPAQHRWLIEDLWADQAVGVVGGEPKCCKSFMVLSMAVAVASGLPCLGRFSVNRPGRVLLFAAEDALHIVRQRLDGICKAAGIDLQALDILVITAPVVRLDLAEDRDKLILDPFVRLHCRNENASQEIAPLLAFLRDLQRKHHTAVVVVHHAKKGAAHSRAGQALRGSSEFHAWGDSNLYLRRNSDLLSLSIEHRAAPSISGIPLCLNTEDDMPCLQISNRTEPADKQPQMSIEDRVRQALAESDGPLSFRVLRKACRIRTANLCAVLGNLVSQQKILKTPDGYTL
jgi:hypothetical protein